MMVYQDYLDQHISDQGMLVLKLHTEHSLRRYLDPQGSEEYTVIKRTLDIYRMKIVSFKEAKNQSKEMLRVVFIRAVE